MILGIFNAVIRVPYQSSPKFGIFTFSSHKIACFQILAIYCQLNVLVRAVYIS